MDQQMNHPSEAPKKPMSGCAKAGIGCGIALVILLIIGVIVGIWVAKNARGWMASGFAAVVNEAVDQSTLPDQQKQAIKSRVDHVKNEFIAGNITVEQIGQAIENLNVEKLISAGFAQYVGSGMIQSSTQLSDEQKAAGEQALNRVAHGLLEDQISPNQINQVLDPIMQTDASGKKQLKPNPTAEELQQVMDKANELADQAGVPEDVAEVDYAERVGRAFDEALGTTP